jgi:hypothetical protein
MAPGTVFLYTAEEVLAYETVVLGNWEPFRRLCYILEMEFPDSV